MSFPDMASLVRRAEIRKFRAPTEGETEDEYREALATYVQRTDMIEAGEIRIGKGWDEWGEAERMDVLQRTTAATVRQCLA
jgi:hypothetical protein